MYNRSSDIVSVFILAGLTCMTASAAAQAPVQPPDNWTELCKTADGRKNLLKKTYGEPYYKDLRLQAAALQVSPDERVDQKAKRLCKSFMARESGSGKELSAEKADSEEKGGSGRTFTFNPNPPASEGGQAKQNAPAKPVLPLFKFYTYVSCKSGWQDTCEDDLKLSVPPGWQACKPTYRIASQRGNGRFEFVPSGWYEGDDEDPPRFRGYILKVRSSGNNEIFNQVGANIHLKDVGIYAIPANRSNEARWRSGCDMARHPQSRRQPTPPKPEPAPAVLTPAKVDSFEKDGKLTLIMENPNEKRVSVRYEVEMKTRGNPKWRRKSWGVIHLNPRSRWTREFHHHDAVDWRFKTWQD